MTAVLLLEKGREKTNVSGPHIGSHDLVVRYRRGEGTTRAFYH